MVCGDLRVNCEDVKATRGASEAEVSLTQPLELTAISNIYPPCYKKVAHYAKFNISTALHFWAQTRNRKLYSGYIKVKLYHLPRS